MNEEQRRGEQGLQGLQGDPGIQGEQGYRGATGSPGGQGTQGDPGLRGSPGVEGNQGAQGESGRRGFRGDRGDAGGRGLQGHESMRRVLVIFAFTVAAFLLLAFRSEVNAGRIEENSYRIDQERIVSVYNDCLHTIEVLERYNLQQQKLAEVMRRHNEIEPEVRDAFIRIYDEGVVPVPDCQDLERPEDESLIVPLDERTN